MTNFRKYDHVERLGHSDVHDLTLGRVHVFPKLDGTNGSVWFDDDDDADFIIGAGSRNRSLSLDTDNQGFMAWVLGDDEQAQALRDLMVANPRWVVYGEWMVPHTLKTYRPDTWRRFWIFDVFDRPDGCLSGEPGRYLSWDDYGLALSNMGLDVVEPLCIINNPSDDQLAAQVAVNTYLIADGAGIGEGIVLKNYDWRNRYGRQPWAKIVRNQFKEEARREHGTTEKDGPFQVEVVIAEHYCTATLVGKTRAKVVCDVANEMGVDLVDDPNAQQRVEADYRHKVIPQLLGRVFNDVVVEHTWDFVKRHKFPVVDFKKLNSHVIRLTKALAQDLF